MYLVVHENFQVNERKSTLYRYKQLKESLHAKLDKLDAEYRYYFPYEMGVLCDLDKQLMQEHAALAEFSKRSDPTPPPPLPDSPKDQPLKRLYRTICNLCHEDKFTDDLSASLKKELTRLFILGKAAYKNKDLNELRHVYDLVVDALSQSTSSVSTQQYKDVVKESDEELIRMLDRQIELVLYQLRELKNHPLYSVFKCQVEDNLDGAKQIYRQILRMKIEELTQALHQIQAARMHAAFLRQTTTTGFYTF